MNDVLLEELESVGADPRAIRWLEKPSPDSIDYLDLVEPTESSLLLKPACVVEHDSQPFVYIVDVSALAMPPDQQELSALKLLRTLALRGDAGFLGLSKPGQLTLYPLILERNPPKPLHVATRSTDSRTLLLDLALGALPRSLRPSQDERRERALTAATHDLLFRLLIGVARDLQRHPSLENSPDDILALVGRALFARFLLDRRILTSESIPQLGGVPESCFSTPKSVIATCKWMDDKFNGDLLPLYGGRYRDFFDRLGDDRQPVCRSLSNIMLRAPGGQTAFELYWNEINFAHVPIGLLSEVYESFAHHIDSHLAATESIRYTPKRIAQMLVDEAIEGVTTCEPQDAVCLDPAAGGGVFLVLLLRKLVAKRWKSTGRRPSRKDIDKILYKQLRGFDINISALKMAALSLYLTAIELDADVRDVDVHRFDPLVGDSSQDRVLTYVRREQEAHPNPFVLGSLDDVVLSSHRGRYDVVVGNPPWTALRIRSNLSRSERNAQAKRLKTLQERYSQVVRRIAMDRNSVRLADVAAHYENPDGVPDLPFVWRAMEWCKAAGVIAFALHGRLLFKRTPTGKAAQNAIFKAIRVTGIVNGAALRQTDVWPNVDAPWCLFFAINELPEDRHVFYFLNPVLETEINSQSRMRIDHGSAEPIEFGVLRDEASLFKTIFRGTALDVDIMRRIKRLDTVPLHAYWKQLGFKSGDGYQLGTGKIAKSLQGKPDLRSGSAQHFAVHVETLPRFDQTTVRRGKAEGFFRGPFVLFPESLRDRDHGRVLLAPKDLVFSESFYGYSAARTRRKQSSPPLSDSERGASPEDYVRYLYVIGYSSLFQYIVLMTSSKFGVERDAMLKEDVDNFPIVPLDRLTSEDMHTVDILSRKIEAADRPWSELDTFVGRLYGLQRRDLEIIADTLSVSLPYTESKRNAESPPSSEQVERFCVRLEAELQAFSSLVDVRTSVSPLPKIAESWRFLSVRTDTGTTSASSIVPDWVSYLCDHHGASQVVLGTNSGALVLGLLAESRYWTQSRASLCARNLVHDFGNLLVPKAANAA